MTALSDADRIRLARLHEIASQMPVAIKAGRTLADALRHALPDLDDVSIGRVVLEVGQFVGRCAEGPGDHSLNALADQIMCAGLDLTALEWREVTR